MRRRISIQAFPMTILVPVLVVATCGTLFAQRRPGRPAPPASRYGYTFVVDVKSLPDGVKIRTVGEPQANRHFMSNGSDVPLVINERFSQERLVGGTKLVSGQVFHYFPNGVPMAGKTHLKGWQAPFGVIKETLLTLPKDPAKIYEGRKPGVPAKLPPNENSSIAAKLDGKPYAIKIKIVYHLNPAYDQANK